MIDANKYLETLETLFTKFEHRDYTQDQVVDALYEYYDKEMIV